MNQENEVSRKRNKVDEIESDTVGCRIGFPLLCISSSRVHDLLLPLRVAGIGQTRAGGRIRFLVGGAGLVGLPSSLPSASVLLGKQQP